MYWGRKAKASEALPSLGARETAQCFGHIINSQLAGINPPPSEGNVCESCVSWHCVFLGETFSVVVWLAVYGLFIAAEVSCNFGFCAPQCSLHGASTGILITFLIWSSRQSFVLKKKKKRINVFSSGVFRYWFSSFPAVAPYSSSNVYQRGFKHRKTHKDIHRCTPHIYQCTHNDLPPCTFPISIQTFLSETNNLRLNCVS